MTDLPESWKLTPLGDCVIINPRRFDNEPGDNEMISVVPMAAVEAESGRMDSSQAARYGEIKKRTLTPFQEGDVLFAKVTPCMENGKIAVARGTVGGRAFGSTELFALRSGGAIDPAFLCYFLLQPKVRKEAQSFMTGAVGLRRVPRSYLEELPIPLPPLAEQRRIVAALDDHHSRLVFGIGELGKSKDRVEKLRHRLEEQAVHGSLLMASSPPQVAQAEFARILDRRALRVSRRRSQAVEPVGQVADLPDHWVLASMDQISWNIEYGTSAKTGPMVDDSDIAVLRMGNIQAGGIVADQLKYLPASHPDVESLLLDEMDVLFNRTNSAELVGKSAAYSGELKAATFASYLIRCRLVDGVEPRWVSLVINSSVGRSYVRSVMSQQVGQANVNGTKLAAMPIPLPPLEEQRQILALLTERLDGLAKMRDAAQVTERKAARLKASLLNEAFSGRLVPQDPNDEPASELLARIRAERAAAPTKQTTRSRRTQKELAAPPTRVTGDNYQQEALPL